MAKHVYWLSDTEWKRIEPLLPRGRKGAHRVDDRRVISGIVHMLRCGARWRDCPEVYGPYTTIYNRFNRWSRQGIWTDIFYALTGSTGMFGIWPSTIRLTSRPTARQRAKRGAFNKAIGRSRGGQTTKIHALTDDIGRPHVLLITAGNVHDLAGARSLLAMGHRPKRVSPTGPMTPTASARSSRSDGSKPSSHQTRPASIPIATIKLPTRDVTSLSACSAG